MRGVDAVLWWLVADIQMRRLGPFQIKERHICHQIFKLYMTFLDLGGVLDLECDLEGDLFL